MPAIRTQTGLKQFMSLVDTFCETVGGAIISPPQYVWWAGVGAVSAMMGRLVYSHTFIDGPHDRLYGNIFSLLVGPPGSGKSKALSEARKLLLQLEVRVGPEDTNGEKLYDLLKTTEDNVSESPGTMSLFLDEFDSLMHSGMSASAKRTLNGLYDCRTELQSRSTYAHGDQNLKDLCMTMMAGCTPAHLHSAFQPLEWHEGFPSRLLLIWGEKPGYAGSYTRGSMEKLLLQAEEVIRFIALNDRITWEADAMEEYKSWCLANWNGKNPHPLLTGYGPRRPLHLAKLAFILAVADCNSKIATVHFRNALSCLSLAEAGFEKCLSLAGGNDTKDIEDFVLDWLATREQINEYEVRRLISMRLPHHLIQGVIEELVSQRLLVQVGAKLAPNRIFRGGKV